MNLLLIIAIPLLSLATLNHKVLRHISKIAPVIFLTLIAGVFFKIRQAHNFSLINFSEEMTFGFALNKTNIRALFLLSFIWTFARGFGELQSTIRTY